MVLPFNYKSQEGAALLIFVLIILIGSTYSLVVKLNSDTNYYIRQSKETQSTLLLAKQALVAYAVNFPEIDDAPAETDPINGPGYLPCPDINKNGSAGGICSFGGATNTTIGRLPYRTLEIPELRDSSGAHLWYALSDNFRNSAGLEPLNSEIVGQITVDGNSDIVAIIIAPGAPIGNQNRDPNEAVIANEIANYLETENNNLDLTFISIDPDPTNFTDFNDRVITITRQELMEQVEKRVLGEVSQFFTEYKQDPDHDDVNGVDPDCPIATPDCDDVGAYPWLAPFADPKAIARQVTGTADACVFPCDNTITLNANDNDFTVLNVDIDDVIYNITDGSVGTVTVVAANSLDTAGLAFGVDNDFDEDDEYVINPQAIPATLSGIANAGGDNTTLVDNSRDLTEIGISINDVIDNITDGSSATISSISANTIEVDGLAGGTDNLFQTNDDYQIRNNYGVATNAVQSATQLDDANKSFINMGVQIDDIVKNLTDSSVGKISVVNANSIVVDKLEFGTTNLFNAGDDYIIYRYNPVSNVREGLLSFHQVGRLFSSSFDISLDISTLSNADIVFDNVNYPAVDGIYSDALETHLENYYAAPYSNTYSASITDGYCIWSVVDIAECLTPYIEENINIDGTVTAGTNTAVITDINATFTVDGVKKGDIVQNYDDEFPLAPAVNGNADEGGTTGTASAGSNNLVLEDAGKDFQALGISIGDDVNNLNDGSSGVVESITATIITVSSLSGGAINTFSDLDNYEVLHSELFDATATFITDGIEAYNHMVFNTTTGVRAVITDVISETRLDAVELSNQANPITFTAGDNYTLYTPGLVVVSATPSIDTQVTTTRIGVYNPDFDLLGTYEEYYRIFPAANSFAGNATAAGGNTLIDIGVDFLNEGITVGDIIENVTDGSSFGEITAVTSTTITVNQLYGGVENDFDNGDVYTVYHDYVYSRKHEYHTMFSGDALVSVSGEKRVREVCMNYTNNDCININPNQDFSGNGGMPLITVRDFEKDGITEVGRATFTPRAATEGSLKVSNIDYYLANDDVDMPSWFFNNDWHKLVYISMSNGDIPNGVPCVAGADCLTLNGAGVPSNNKNVLVVMAGMEINTTLDNNCTDIAPVSTAQNRANGDINEYYESENCDAGDDFFKKQFATGTFNDQVRIIEPNP